MTTGQLNRREALRRLILGIADDSRQYASLEALLEQQFDAAVHHDTARLGELAGAIGAACELLELRRAERQQLAASLLGPGTGIGAVFDLLKGAAREALQARWRGLEQAVVACQRLAKRNSDLLAEQFSIMQRVLHGEDQVYAPA